MSNIVRRLLLVIAVTLSVFTQVSYGASVPSSARSVAAIKSVKPALVKALADKNLRYGSPIFMRIFKREAILELWVESESGTYSLFKAYDICSFSGDLGPKLKEGDRQSPEGFYFVRPGQMNPHSQFHLSFNLGYPNAYDRYHKRTGSALMVHGNCVSIGCYAMTDPLINEIYALAHGALENGQPFFRVHVFPFVLDASSLAEYTGSQWYGFWKNLQAGYQWFETHKKPPNVEVKNGLYIYR